VGDVRSGTPGTTVVSAEAGLLRVPRNRPVKSSYASYDALEVVTVRVRTADGLEGLGYAKIIGTGGAAIRSFAETEYLSRLPGRDAGDIKALWEELHRHAMSRGRKGVAMYALSAVDIALWDLLAQRAGLPLHHLLGSTVDRVPVYGNGCWLSLTLPELVAEAERYAEMGCFGVKVKIGGRPQDDVARVRAVREAVGEDMAIMVDANSRYDPLTAIRVARLLEPFDLTWFEEPVLADSPSDYVKVTRAVNIPVAGGENEYTRYGFRELIEREALDVVQPDVHRVGGVTEFLRIAAMAEAWSLPIYPHTSYELHSQLVAAIPGARWCEYYDWLPEGFFAEDFTIVDGHVRVPTRPGIAAAFADGVHEKFGVDA
jgi:L-alanine-DL-glutamate epimerase-like enolase superfamily enzyme